MELGQKLRIIVAEDEYLELMGFHGLLKELGHEVVGEALDGLEAIKLAVKLQPDLILMDINLPSLDGISAAEAINRKIKIPVIIVTGYAKRALIEKAAANTGVYGFLVKPVDGKDLAAAIPIAMARFAEINQAHDLLDGAKRALEERKCIERAKGILMQRLGLGEADAMRELQHRSRDRNTRLPLIAMEIIRAEQTLASSDRHVQS